MSGVHRVVQVNASQHGEYEGLQVGHKELKGCQDDNAHKRKRGSGYPEESDTAARSERSERNDEPGEKFKRNVPPEHVSEQTKAKCNRPEQE